MPRGRAACPLGPVHGSPRPGDAHAVQAAGVVGPGGPAAWGRPGLHLGHPGIKRPPTRDEPGGARAPNGDHIWVDPTRGLVVLGRPGARVRAALRAGSPPPGPTPGAEQPPPPLLAGGIAPGPLRGVGRQGIRLCLPRGTARRLHEDGEVATPRPHGGSLVDGSQSVRPCHADQLHVPPLRGSAVGRGPRPVGLPRAGALQGDITSLAA